MSMDTQVVLAAQQVPISITTLVVAIPARNEEHTIARALRSVLAAADELCGAVRVRVVVACDSCVDATAKHAGEVAARDARVHVVSGAWASPGAARAAAIDAALMMPEVADQGRDAIWLATTDADTTVPARWLIDQLGYAAAGFDAIAGVVELIDDSDHTPAIRAMFATTYTLEEHTHRHVHGANLGVRADAYIAVGGFPTVAAGEDHDLWNALGRAGFSRHSPRALSVATSARVHGRAIGGFADTLRERLTVAANDAFSFEAAPGGIVAGAA